MKTDAASSLGQMNRRLVSQVHGRRSTTSMITTSTSDQMTLLARSSRAPACLMSGQYRAVKPHRMYVVRPCAMAFRSATRSSVGFTGRACHSRPTTPYGFSARAGCCLARDDQPQRCYVRGVGVAALPGERDRCPQPAIGCGFGELHVPRRLEGREVLAQDGVGHLQLVAQHRERGVHQPCEHGAGSQAYGIVDDLIEGRGRHRAPSTCAYMALPILLSSVASTAVTTATGTSRRPRP